MNMNKNAFIHLKGILKNISRRKVLVAGRLVDLSALKNTHSQLFMHNIENVYNNDKIFFRESSRLTI